VRKRGNERGRETGREKQRERGREKGGRKVGGGGRKVKREEDRGKERKK